MLAALALLATACGGSTTAEAGSSGSSGGDTSDGPGVTADTVKVGFIALDTTKLESALKLQLPAQGDQQAQIDALVAWANDNGGIGGRTIEPVVRTYDALLDSAANEEKLCNEFTQDDGVFAVMLWGMFQENLRPCFQQASTVMVENTLYPLPRDTMRDLRPYYLSPTLPTYDDVVAGLAGAFEETGYLEGEVTLGILGVDTEANRTIYEEQLLPALQEAGVEPVEVRWIDLTDDANIRAGYEQAVIAYKAAGVDRLVTVGGSRLLSYFLDYAKRQDFRPRLALTTYDNPEYNIVNYNEFMPEAVGLSVVPGWDIQESQLPMPHNDSEAECLDMYAAAGITFGTRNEARTALLNCDSVVFLQRAADAIGIDAGSPLNAELLYEGALELGDDWQAAGNYGTAFSGVVAAGPSAYMALAYDASCNCMVLVGEPRDF